MAEASLAFPMICLTLSFLFVVAVYHPSIIQHLGAFRHHIILPVYQQIARKLFNRNPIYQNLPNRVPEAEYEALNLDTEDEEEQSPSPLATSSTSTPDYHRHDEEPAPDTLNMLSERGSGIEMDDLSRAISYAGGPYRPRRWSDFAELADLSTSRSRSPSGPLAVFEPQNRTDDIPVWQFELERPIYTVDNEHQQGGLTAWVDEVVEWTSQGIFASVSADIMEQQR
ncbi:unnamed protein product [Penicillium viridicatum]